MKKLKIKYVEYGLGNHFKTHIELNKELKKNELLHNYVLAHEMGHSDQFDLAHEFKIEWKIMPSLILFVISHPKTWIDFLPIQYRKGKIIYDLNLIILYIFLLILSVVFVKIFF